MSYYFAVLSELCDLINGDVYLNSLRFERRYSSPKWPQGYSLACLVSVDETDFSGSSLEVLSKAGCFIRFKLPIVVEHFKSHQNTKWKQKQFSFAVDIYFGVYSPNRIQFCDDILSFKCHGSMFSDVFNGLKSFQVSGDQQDQLQQIRLERQLQDFDDRNHWDPPSVCLHDLDFGVKVLGVLRGLHSEYVSILSCFSTVR